MTHYCTTCLSEFDDDSGPLPDAAYVHCVFCGARIALASRPRPPASVVPFSKDYEREEAFALGVINGNGPGFPDTLREFRVRSSQRGLDSLTPLAQGSEPPAPSTPPALRAPQRLASLSASLSVGFGIGVAIAFAAVSLRPEAKAPSVTATSPAPRPAAAALRKLRRRGPQPSPRLLRSRNR
jgi:DNA-directed RNA polymerase subunit RPC12/RpoP